MGGPDAMEGEASVAVWRGRWLRTRLTKRDSVAVADLLNNLKLVESGPSWEPQSRSRPRHPVDDPSGTDEMGLDSPLIV